MCRGMSEIVFFKIGRSWVVDELFSSTENPSFRDVCLQNKADCSNVQKYDSSSNEWEALTRRIDGSEFG